MENPWLSSLLPSSCVMTAGCTGDGLQGWKALLFLSSCPQPGSLIHSFILSRRISCVSTVSQELLLLLLLSHFSRVWLCVTPQTAAHQAPVPGILQARTLEWVAIRRGQKKKLCLWLQFALTPATVPSFLTCKEIQIMNYRRSDCLSQTLANKILEKTLESHLGSKEVKPVNPKGNQPWIFRDEYWIFRVFVPAEAPIIWPPDAKSWLIGKDPDAGKDWRQEEKRVAEVEMVR